MIFNKRRVGCHSLTNTKRILNERVNPSYFFYTRALQNAGKYRPVWYTPLTHNVLTMISLQPSIGPSVEGRKKKQTHTHKHQQSWFVADQSLLCKLERTGPPVDGEVRWRHASTAGGSRRESRRFETTSSRMCSGSMRGLATRSCSSVFGSQLCSHEYLLLTCN